MSLRPYALGLALLVGVTGSLACKKDEAPAPAPAASAAPAPAAAPTTMAAPAVQGPTSAELGKQFPPGQNCQPEAAQAALKPYNPRVTACYREGLARNPDLGGRLVMNITVGADGRATKVEAAEDELKSPEVASCIRGVLEAAAYAPAPADRPCTIAYPLDLKVGERLR